MKSLLVSFLMMAGGVCFGQSSDSERVGIIQKVDGYYIYMFSSPEEDYETLGFIKPARIVWTGKPKEMFRLMMNKIRSNYPNCDAVIVEDIGLNKARAIKFK